MKLSLAHEFSRVPGPRYRSEGPWSGEAFREELLVPRLREHPTEVIEINLDGTQGYGVSFLREAFGELPRILDVPGEEILARLHFQSREEPYLVPEIQDYIRNARDR